MLWLAGCENLIPKRIETTAAGPLEPEPLEKNEPAPFPGVLLPWQLYNGAADLIAERFESLYADDQASDRQNAGATPQWHATDPN